MPQGQEEKVVCIQAGSPVFNLFKALNKSKSYYVFKLRFRHLTLALNIIRKKLSTHS